jgi:hypothetical protein
MTLDEFVAKHWREIDAVIRLCIRPKLSVERPVDRETRRTWVRDNKHLRGWADANGVKLD